jgi:fumarate hydratase, class II
VLEVARELTDLSAADLGMLLDPLELTRGGIKGGGSAGG